MTRVAVIGHVEWATNALASVPFAAGDIVNLHDAFEEPGGGGGVSARVLPSLGADHTRFYTALARDPEGQRTVEILQAEGVELCVTHRPGRQNRALTVRGPDGDRTIFVLGPNEHPSLDDPLPWDDLATFDGVFFTGDDPRTLVAARRARVVVATMRRLEAVIASGVEVDVLIGSANDPAEQFDESLLPVTPRVIVRTDGARGGSYRLSDGTTGRWDAVPLSGPVVDAYGAGDAFMAGLTLALARGDALPDALRFAAGASAAQLLHRGGGPPPRLP